MLSYKYNLPRTKPSLAKPVPEEPKPFIQRLWTPTEELVLRQFADLGYSGSQIAEKLQRSRESVIGKAHRLKLELNGQKRKSCKKVP